jgi:hypothetical protein
MYKESGSSDIYFYHTHFLIDIYNGIKDWGGFEVQRRAGNEL